MESQNPELQKRIYSALCGDSTFVYNLQELLSQKPDLNFHIFGGYTPLVLALNDFEGCGISLQGVEMLVKAGADVNMKAKNGLPPLIAAVLSSRPDAVELLIKSGADVNAVDGEGYTAAMRIWPANDRQPREILKLLIGAGIDLKKTGAGGVTARDIAARNGRFDLVQMIDQVLGK